MDAKPTLKVSAIIADLNGYIAECEKFEKENIVKEKHVSSQIIQMANPNYVKGISLASTPQQITTVMISIIYIHEMMKKEVIKN